MVKPTELPLHGRERACMIVENGVTYCIDPLQEPLKVISKRWCLLVIGVLGNSDFVRFGVVKRTIPGISARALSTALQELQAQGLVKRRVDPDQSPPAVSYRLTADGHALRRALIPLIHWAEGHVAP